MDPFAPERVPAFRSQSFGSMAGAVKGSPVLQVLASLASKILTLVAALLETGQDQSELVLQLESPLHSLSLPPSHFSK